MQNINHYGKKKYGHGFRLYQEDKETWFKLYAYFTNNQDLCKKYCLDLRKGLILSGPVGCGKTSMLSLWNILLSNETNFTTRSANQLALQFAEKGYALISFYGNLKDNILLDDLGAEQNIKHYGNDCNVIQEILTLRHEAYIRFGFLTHITTNLTSLEIENKYGARIRSRLRQMSNLIVFSSFTTDKRV